MTSLYSRILLTGATGGIGRAVAQALDEKGYSILLSGRNEAELARLSDSLSGSRHEALSADLATKEGVETLARAAASFGIDGLVNCLGVNRLAGLTALGAEDINQIVNANLVAPMQVCRAVLPQLLASPNAVVLNVGSILGSIGYAGSSAYCAAKFGLKGFTESLRRELADSRVAVIYFAPRATNTPLNSDAMNRMNAALGNAVDEPEHVAAQMVRALESGRSSSHYLGWPEPLFVRLNGLLPGLVDKALYKQLPVIKRFCQAD